MANIRSRCEAAIERAGQAVEPSDDRTAILARLLRSETDRGDFAATLLRLLGPGLRMQILSILSDMPAVKTENSALIATARIVAAIEQTAS